MSNVAARCVSALPPNTPDPVHAFHRRMARTTRQGTSPVPLPKSVRNRAHLIPTAGQGRHGVTQSPTLKLVHVKALNPTQKNRVGFHGDRPIENPHHAKTSRGSHSLTSAPSWLSLLIGQRLRLRPFPFHLSGFEPHLPDSTQKSFRHRSARYEPLRKWH